MKRMGWDDQIRHLKTIDQVHVRAGEGWRGWDVIIRWEILKQLTKFTYELEKDEEDGMDNQMRDLKAIDQVHVPPGDGWRGWDGIIRWEILKQLIKFHVQTGDGWSGWDGIIRWEVLKQLTNVTYLLETDDGIIRWEILKQLIKFTYELETDEEDGMG